MNDSGNKDLRSKDIGKKDGSKDISNDILYGLLENPYIGIILVDTKGLIYKINKTYLDILGLREEDVLNKHVSDITPHSRLPEVLKTGKVHLTDYWPVNGHDTLVFRMLLYKEGKLIGAMGQSLVLDAGGAKVLSQKLKEVEKELTVYKEAVNSMHSAKYSFADIVGQDNSMTATISLAQKAAYTGSTVLIQGESGTGKELFANAIHQASPRRNSSFVRVNCAAMPDNLLESELFGYEEGAFTGARKGGKLGKFEIANNGTIFLDEIGDMPMSLQAKLLVVLQEREFERIGGTKPIRVDVQVIAATNRCLEELVRQGRFRGDLYYRLNVVTLNIPPLRERPLDIKPLIDFLLPRLNKRMNSRIKSICGEALQLLTGYDWPGNVRELENILERAINMADLNHSSCLSPEYFPSLLAFGRPREGKRAAETVDPDNLPGALEKLEKETIVRVLQQTNHNITQAAKLLGLNRSGFYRKLKKYKISPYSDS